MDVMGILSVAIAIAGFAFSAWVYFSHDRKIKALDIITKGLDVKLKEGALKKMQEEEFNSKRARIVASIESEEGDTRLIVRNIGKAAANNVGGKFDPELPLDRRIFPVEFMNPGDSVQVSLLLAMSDPRKTCVTFQWVDEAGEQTYSQILMLK